MPYSRVFLPQPHGNPSCRRRHRRSLALKQRGKCQRRHNPLPLAYLQCELALVVLRQLLLCQSPQEPREVRFLLLLVVLNFL